MIRHYALAIFVAAAAAATVSASAADKPGQPTIDAPLSPLEAAATMQVPEGFKVTLFAGEPDVQQPIGFCIDDRGRLWVAEAYAYPNHSDQPGKDRILIFEDTDNDGVHDKRTVFYDKLNYVTGIEVGFGGAWVMSPPYFYFIADKNADDIPDSEPEVLLDGFGNHANSHNIANGFAWGPDGWLYGTHGRTNWSMIGKPGAAKAERQRFDGGVWRYHPVRHEWEPYCDGTTNPWGIDWNEYGEAFVSNCVNPHLFHVIQGAHYEPWRGRESSQYAYDRIGSIADHLHFVDGDHTVVGTDEIKSLGGGHAHCGMMIYQGTNWPEKYRNTVFMNNIHGKRINNDLPERKGSGYVAHHGEDFAISKDPWFMGVTMQYGPDGGVFVIDWSDTGECHSTTNTRRETGRIFKITYGDEALEMPTPALPERTMDDLAWPKEQDNQWIVGHSRRMLQEAHASGQPLKDQKRMLLGVLFPDRWTGGKKHSTPTSLNALWALHSMDALQEGYMLLLKADQHVFAWAIRLMMETREPSELALASLPRAALINDSALIRRYIASALQRLPLDQRLPLYHRWSTLEILLDHPKRDHAEDAEDQNLPLMYWYAFEPLVADDIDRFIDLGSRTRIPLIRHHVARRATEFENAAHLSKITSKLEHPSRELRKDILRGILDGLDDLGIQDPEMATNWKVIYAALLDDSDAEVHQLAFRLALRFNDPIALKLLNDQVRDPNEKPEYRRAALKALIDYGGENLAALLFTLVDDPQAQDLAIRGLANCDHPDIATSLIKLAPTLDPAARRDAIQTLASRAEWATALLDAVDAGTIDKSDIGAFAARQMQNLGDKKLTNRLQKTWGDLKVPSKDKARTIESFRKKLTPESIAAADPHKGRVMFQNLCASCHKMFGEGGEVGPEITGSQRTNIDYLLENLVDPSAAVAQDFQLLIIETTGGRTLSGFVRSENDNALTLQSINEQVVVPLSEIKKRTPAEVSIMPEGLLQTMTTEQIRDLFAYLSSPGQVNPAAP